MDILKFQGPKYASEKIESESHFKLGILKKGN